MKTEIFTLCDYAHDYSGKLMIVGTFTSLSFNSKEGPFTLPDFAVVARIKIGKEEIGSHNVKLLIREDDSDTYLVHTEHEIPEYQQMDAPIYINCIINLKSVKATKLGSCEVQLLIDDKIVDNIQLLISSSVA